MPSAIESLVQDCTVRITASNERVLGTGCLVAPGLVLTAAHVVKDAGSDELIVVPRGRPASVGRVLPSTIDGELDIALLKTDLDGHPCIRLGGEPSLKDGLYIFGYSRRYPNGEGDVAVYAGTDGNPELIKMSQCQVVRGFSGAPVLHLDSQQICGIVCRSRDVDTNLGGRAVPANVILRRFPELAKLQEEFHRTNPLWPTRAALGRQGHQQLHRLAPERRSRLTAAQYFTGRKRYLTALANFWTGPMRVVSLVGAGGMGKTAIVRHYLDQRGWLAQQIPGDGPDALFVRSFYDPGDADRFVWEACNYFGRLRGEPPLASDAPVSPYALCTLLKETPGRKLLVLDGLEILQSSGAKHEVMPIGALDDGAPVRYLLSNVLAGNCGDTKVIITSRYMLTDLAHERGPFFKEHKVDELTLLEARRLLERTGVQGSKQRLDALLETHGRHALIIDLLGHYISAYCGGDPLVAVDLQSLRDLPRTEELDPLRARIAKVLEAYTKALTPEQYALMRLLSVFRFPVTTEFMWDCVGALDHPVLEPLKGSGEPGLRNRLYELVELRLVIEQENDLQREESTKFSQHPIIRDFFYRDLADPAPLHGAVRALLEDIANKPSFVRPTDSAAIDLLEGLIYHSIESGHREEAYAVYKQRLGGYMHIGWVLGSHPRGARIIRLFESESDREAGAAMGARGTLEQGHGTASGAATAPPSVGSEAEGRGAAADARVAIDAALYRKNYGRLGEAVRLLRRVERDAGPESAAVALQNISAIQVLQGLLPDAVASGKAAVQRAAVTTDERLKSDCQVRIATALAMRGGLGDVDEAEQLFLDAQRSAPADRQSRDPPGIRHGWLLIRQERYEDAAAILNEQRTAVGEKVGAITSRIDILLAELACRRGEWHETEAPLQRVYEWVSTSFDQEMLIAAMYVDGLHRAGLGDFAVAQKVLKRGIAEAEEYGYGIYWIDLTLALAEISRDRAVERELAREALEGARRRRGRRMPGAAAPECSYAWGERIARAILK